MTLLIFNNVRLIFHRLALVVIVITALVTSVAMACSVWNEGSRVTVSVRTSPLDAGPRVTTCVSAGVMAP